MDKKDIYEHLAKIYLDAAVKKKDKKKTHPQFFRALFSIGILFVFGVGLILFSALPKHKPLNSEVELVLTPYPLKINFNFDPVKKEIYTLYLNALNLNSYKTLGFAVKKANFKNVLSLRVEFSNSFREKSEIYVKNVPNKWQDYKINFSDFKSISEWSEMQSLSFTVEEWNTKDKKGVVYIDNVRFLK